MNNYFRANGKLLLTGEYFVLDGVPALAVPTKKGQSLTIYPGAASEGMVSWLAYLENGATWLSTFLSGNSWRTSSEGGGDAGQYLAKILYEAESMLPGCTDVLLAARVETQLEFDRLWGLGSSSTLISMLAEAFNISPYELLERTFGGSGYDLACAIARGPIIYERNGNTPKVTALDWRPQWLQQTCFVYRNQKQNSREGIRAYRAASVNEREKKAIGEITMALSDPTLDLRAAARLLRQHETLVAETLCIDPVQDELFSDFPGQLKSLGAWGGDFIWALSEESPEKVRAYFNTRGYETVIGYEEMVL